MDSPAVRLCHEKEIAEGRTLGFDTQGEGTDTLFVVRHHGRLHAWRNACPHVDGAPMAWRRHAYMNAAGTHVACHAHGALFLPDTGLCVQGPCLGKSLQALKIEIDHEGHVFVNTTQESETKKCQQ
jgi:nitrite reductase/ring-hydroxylating ferredoxin subunit